MGDSDRQMTIVAGPKPFDEELLHRAAEINPSSDDWIQSSIRLPQPITAIVGDIVDEKNIGFYKVVSASISYGHDRFQSEFEPELLELDQLFTHAQNSSKFASEQLSSRNRANHYETGIGNGAMSQPKPFFIKLSREGQIEQQARWLNFEKSMLYRHLIAISLHDSTFGRDTIWQEELEDLVEGLDSWIRDWQVPAVITLADGRDE